MSSAWGDSGTGLPITTLIAIARRHFVVTGYLQLRGT